MTNPVGRDVARKLILEWADVVVDSFTPRVMPGWGLAYADLSQTRPDLIMLSTCMQGQTGPVPRLRRLRRPGRGAVRLLHAQRLAGPRSRDAQRRLHRHGHAPLRRRRDDWPRWITARAPVAGSTSTCRRSSAASTSWRPQVLDYTVRGHVPQRMANRSLRAAPHGVFPVQGERRLDRHRLRDRRPVAGARAGYGLAGLGHGPSAPPRWQVAWSARTTLEARLADWTRSQHGAELQRQLLEAAYPAGVAYPDAGPLRRPAAGRTASTSCRSITRRWACWKYDELGFKLPDSPSQLRTAAPLLGQHTELVLKEFLGYSDAEYQALVDAGALQ